MEFLDEAETRPRFLFQSRSTPPSPPETHPPSLHKTSLLISLSLSTLLFSLPLLSPPPEPPQSPLLWLALSLLLGPFAPSSPTAGDIRVGAGKILEPPPSPSPSPDLDKKTPSRRSRPRKPDELGLNPVQETVEVSKNGEDLRGSCQLEGNLGDKSNGGEREWDEGDYELLKKLLVKHPVGKPRRWEAVAEGFKGRHGVDSVIKAAKSTGERKTNDADSFARFLKDRKLVDKRIEEEAESGGDGGVVVESGEVVRESVGWSGGDDIALLNALKAFPKDAPMRWEKIAAAVPGKSKAGCVKRVAELKKGFRSSKASAEA
ncbi:transcription factor MAMYB [Rhododendron vialii]|uniref:transcription factor MAMYB n=1 Tax=Rhododendron vialii TaxID=182163 RepID=UPI00265F13FC|nr:transcription factor MAMYB [Rhododendron vialii]XP_058224355.1 transcription factor MAMYB [Rhododendron vialii]XP_058224356.1 transcription factor MAMYB [Rhododendron vialii]